MDVERVRRGTNKMSDGLWNRGALLSGGRRGGRGEGRYRDEGVSPGPDRRTDFNLESSDDRKINLKKGEV